MHTETLIFGGTSVSASLAPQMTQFNLDLTVDGAIATIVYTGGDATRFEVVSSDNGNQDVFVIYDFGNGTVIEGEPSNTVTIPPIFPIQHLYSPIL